MADLIAMSALGLQYATIVLIFDWYSGWTLSLWAVLLVFLALAIIAFVVWDTKESSEKTKEWTKLIRASLLLGAAFLGGDVLLALLHGDANPLRFPGGILGIPLTLGICPGFTSICVAGLLRAVYIQKTERQD